MNPTPPTSSVPASACLPHPPTLEPASACEKHGFEVMTVDVSELAKAEGAVTCCSLLVP